MKTKEQAMEAIRGLYKEHEGIKLSLGEKGVAMWKEGKEIINSETWKHIGYVSALSWVFDITQGDLKNG